jgi:hypothetical protein
MRRNAWGANMQQLGASRSGVAPSPSPIRSPLASVRILTDPTPAGAHALVRSKLVEVPAERFGQADPFPTCPTLEKAHVARRQPRRDEDRLGIVGRSTTRHPEDDYV